MRICHITPHLPPDQTANALLPFHLGQWAIDAGDEPVYVAHTPRAAGTSTLPGPVTWIPRPGGAPPRRRSPLRSLLRSALIARRVAPVIAAADLVHLHSNGLLTELSALIARRFSKPTVLTLYGTEVWHYRSRRGLVDLFTRAYRHATHVTFYSNGLLERAREFGLRHPRTSVIYPPVAAPFVWGDASQQAKARAELGLAARHVLLNVKRLHPLAGQRFAIEALSDVVRRHPDTLLIICGSGPALPELREVTRRTGVEAHVRFAGLIDNERLTVFYAAADVFLLPSLLEACPTVALEALACGTPVISSDNPGGIELNDLFGRDVRVVPREDSSSLADAIAEFLEHKTRTQPETRARIERELRPEVVSMRFRAVYEAAVQL